MKKLFIYGTMALMALTSCNDFLDKAPLDAFLPILLHIGVIRVILTTNAIRSITTIQVMETAVVADGTILRH